MFSADFWLFLARKAGKEPFCASYKQFFARDDFRLLAFVEVILSGAKLG